MKRFIGSIPKERFTRFCEIAGSDNGVCDFSVQEGKHGMVTIITDHKNDWEKLQDVADAFINRERIRVDIDHYIELLGGDKRAIPMTEEQVDMLDGLYRRYGHKWVNLILNKSEPEISS